MSRIAAARLANQRLSVSGPRDPVETVAWFGAVQAQEYGAAKWAVAQRTRGHVADAAVEAALTDGRILRTHLMRPTWHFVAADDVRWLLDLTAPRVHQALRWGHGQLGTDASLRARAMRIIERALVDEPALTRPELGERLAREGIAVKGTALALVVMHAELEGVICSGPHRGNRSTYTLLDRRAPHARRLPRDEALAELTRRYFQSHGPATIRDYVWWSGLTTADARRGLDAIKARSEAVDGLTYWSVKPSRVVTPPNEVHLLPIYDEYLVAYRDLDAVPRGPTRWGILPQALVSRGQVAGEWRAVDAGERVSVEVRAARRLTARERAALAREAVRYGRFRGQPSTLAVR